MNTNTDDLIAAFLAKGNKVTKVAEGEGMGLSNAQWYRKSTDASLSGRVVAGEFLPDSVQDANDLIAQRRVVIDHMDREIVVNGLGERIS